MRPLIALAPLLLLGGGFSPFAGAGVRSLSIEARGPFEEGRRFGERGPYERIDGSVLFEFDPSNRFNRRIVDLELAPRNERGRVEARANFTVLQPLDPERRSGTALVEVSNRGGRAALSYFHRDRTEDEPLGDALLLRLGLTIIQVGWQWDVPEREGVLRLAAPIARDQGEPIIGLVRSDWVVEGLTDTLSIGHRGHLAYPPVDLDDPTRLLTVRGGRDAPRELVPPFRWRFSAPDRITLEGGFTSGRIYELVYRARDPRVVGLGLAAIRDIIAYAKHGEDCPFPVTRGVAFGISQTGRFLRMFLYQGFNTDEQGRAAYDGLLIHAAGAGRGSFNHRFAQPSRDAHRYSAFFYPTDLFPFTSRTQLDPGTGRSDGLLAHPWDPEHAPRTFFTNTGYEYWGRAAALMHTDPLGRADVPPKDHERIYHLSSAQHYVGRFPPRGEPIAGASYRGNPLNVLFELRALLVRLLEWVEHDRPPPPSSTPTLADGTLVALSDYRLPAMSGVEPPRVVHQAYRADYGPRFGQGIIDLEPPRLGPVFPSLVPATDALGNERGGLFSLETLVPVATYLPWSTRIGLPGEQHELADFEGQFIPLPLTEEEREQTGDARPSLEALYASKEEYLQRCAAAATWLSERGLLLEEDRPALRAWAGVLWDWVESRGG